MIYQLVLLSLVLASASAQCNATFNACPNKQVSPSVALAFDFGAGTALAANRATFLKSLTDNVLNTNLLDANNATIVNFNNGGLCSANLGATVGTPATGVIGCQTPPLVVESQYSCAFSLASGGFYQPFIDCMNNNLPSMSSGSSDIVSALARVRNGGTACNGLLNSCSNNVFIPCSAACGTFAATNNNLLIIFWSSPLSSTDKTNAQKWLTSYMQNKYVNVILVPIVSPGLTSANKTDWTDIQAAYGGNPRFDILPNEFNNTANITNTFDPASLTKTMTDLSAKIVTSATATATCDANPPPNPTAALCDDENGDDQCAINAQNPQAGVCTSSNPTN